MDVDEGIPSVVIEECQKCLSVSWPENIPNMDKQVNCTKHGGEFECPYNNRKSGSTLINNQPHSGDGSQSDAHEHGIYRCWTASVYTLLLLVLIFSQGASGFNLDVDNAIKFNIPESGAYFGYTVAMLKRSATTKWVLFGAPRASSRFLPSASRPGAIHRCDLSPDVFSGHTCDEIQIDALDDTTVKDYARFNGTNRVFIHGRSDQWLGASLDVHPDKGIVTCASRWYNQYFLKDGYFFMNGICYEIPLDFSPTNIQKIPALVDGKKQTMSVNNVTKLVYGMGGLGASVHYANQGNDLLMGAPGLWAWTGGFVGMSSNRNFITEYNKPPEEISEMAGYAMTSGNYFGNGQTIFAIGGPRDQLTGKVYLFQSERAQFVMKETFLTLDGSETNGMSTMPVNGFFGAALCSVDVNKDGRDDLIVGAPMYSEGKVAETGLVLVYLGQADYTFKLMRDRLKGSESEGGRFGTAIASLGDLNSDGYNDIIIGAPYEDNLQGAVYIYNGCKSGIWSRFSQRIGAATASPGTLGFGVSFSKPQDMNDDLVNDIAIGAYLSDSAFLMFGKSVINVDIVIKTSVTMINPATSNTCASPDGASTVPCFRLDVCFRYNRRSISVIDLMVTTVLDTYMADFVRVVWQNGGQATLKTPLKVFHNEESCIGWQNVVIKSSADLVTPVRIQAGFTVTSFNAFSPLLPEVNQFNGDKPEQNLLVATSLLEFKKDCPNNDCKTNLKVAAKAEYEKHNDHFIVGTSDLDLDITITKQGDPSYSSNIFVAFPKSVQFLKIHKIYGDTEVSCGFLDIDDDDTTADSGAEEDTNSLEYLQRQLVPRKDDSELMMACSFGNPLYNNTGVRFLLKMRVPEYVTDTQLTFRLNATTLSTELVPADNTQSLTVTLRNKVTTAFKGVSRPSYITVRDKGSHYELSHVFELRNQGPSPLPAADIMIEYPQVQLKNAIQLRLNATDWSCRPPCNITCKFPDVENTAPVVYAAGMGPTYSASTDDGNIGESTAYSNLKNTDCEKHTCSRYECKLHYIPPRESAVVTLHYVATGNILDIVADGQRVILRSESTVTFGELDRLISSVQRHFTHVITDLNPVTPPKKPLAWWIILVSVLAGLFLILIVVAILWKIGFFKRKSLEEMQAMQHTGEVEKMIPDEDEAATVGEKE